ncbi:MAG: hypothetical protein ACI84K_001538 [Pseudohongiellaceae bacterium]|jgi:hypothetical protein
MEQRQNLSRRKFLYAGSGVVLSALSFPALSAGISSDFDQEKSLRFLIKRGTSFYLSDNDRVKLEHAVFDFLKDNYAGMSLQFWEQPFEQIDFKNRLTNIIYWVNKAVKYHESLYPVDPIWVVSQIKAESLFCEFALSPAMAAGICQFMPYTARQGHQMIVAGDLPEHHLAPYIKPELANSLTKYNALIKTRRTYIKNNKSAKFFNLDKALEFLRQDKLASKEAQKQVNYLTELGSINERIRQAKYDYHDYIHTNITELGKRDLFGESEFFNNFDQRFTYQKPIFAMVKMLANALRVRNGNILSASAAYNAGLSKTWTTQPIYKRYGFIPAYEETSRYVSKVVANYEEISLRYTKS